MTHNNWKRIALITSTETVWFESGLNIKKQLEIAGIQVLVPAAFEPGNFKPAVLSEIRYMIGGIDPTLIHPDH